MAQTTQITLPRFVINGSALDVIVFIYDRQTINEKRKRNNTTPRTTVPGRFLPNHDQLTLFVRRLQLNLTLELILWSVRGRHVAVLRSCFFQCSIQSVSVVFKRLWLPTHFWLTHQTQQHLSGCSHVLLHTLRTPPSKSSNLVKCTVASRQSSATPFPPGPMQSAAKQRDQLRKQHGVSRFVENGENSSGKEQHTGLVCPTTTRRYLSRSVVASSSHYLRTLVALGEVRAVATLISFPHHDRFVLLLACY